ncbi:MAG: DPP IV N-terminal domain-containing protein, partial [bacterium]
MNKFSLIIICTLLSFSGVSIAQAESTLYYGRVSNFQNDQVIINYSHIGNPLNFLCDLATWTCESYGTSTPEIDEDTVKAGSDYLSSRVSKDLTKNRASFITKSPTKRYVAYFTSAKLSEGERRYSLWDTKKNKKYDANKKITYWDLLSEENKLFEFSPDEKRLVYINDRDGYPMLYYIDLANLKGSVFSGKKLFEKVYTVNDFTFIDKDRMLFVANRDNPLRWGLYLYNFKAGSLKKVADDVSYTYRMKKIGKYIVYTQTTANVSGPVFYDPSTGASKKLPTIKP